MKRVTLLGVILALWSAVALAADSPKVLTGKVVGVTDGDTLTLLVGKTQHKIRLDGIDAPEKRQPFGDKAKRALSEKVFGKTVKVMVRGKDRYGRTLGIVFFDGCTNAQLVRGGWAWHYKQFSDSKTLAKAEEEAREAKCGLWAGAVSPLPPWEWRRHGKKEAEVPKRLPEKGKKEEVRPPAVGSPIPQATRESDAAVYVTRTGKKYHRDGCRSLSRSKIPISLSEAQGRYGPCGICNPPIQDATPAVPQAKPAASSDSHWITTSSGIRHNSSCREGVHRFSPRGSAPRAGWLRRSLKSVLA